MRWREEEMRIAELREKWEREARRVTDQAGTSPEPGLWKEKVEDVTGMEAGKRGWEDWKGKVRSMK